MSQKSKVLHTVYRQEPDGFSYILNPFFVGLFKTVRGFMDAFGQVAMCASVLIIVALTCERHFAIRSPHRVSKM